MSGETSHLPGGGAPLGGPTLTGEVLTERVHWLIKMRWLAVAGMLGLTAFARWGLDIGVDAGSIFALAGVVTGYNLMLWAYLGRRERRAREEQPAGAAFSLRGITNAQIAMDLVVLTLVLHYSGGVTNPLAVFMVFHMAIASVLLPRGDAFAQALWASLLYAALTLLEMNFPQYHWTVRGFPPDASHEGLSSGLFQHEVFVLAQCVVLATTLLLIVFFTSDISRRLRETYRQLSAAHRELARLEETKSRFLRVASHQLRGPLAAVHSLLSAMGDPAADGEQAAALLRRAQGRAETMMSLLDEMLTLAAVKEGTAATAQRGPVWLNAVLQSTVALHASTAKEKQVSLAAELDGDCQVVSWDKALDDVFGNLVHNAVKYTPAGGTVEVATKRSGRGVTVTVRDSGIGIPEEDQGKLFTEFYRAGNAKQFANGTGLGLSIVKEAVGRLGGRVTVESKENQGTTVRVELPTV